MGGVEEKRGDLDKAVEYYKKAMLEQKDAHLKKRVTKLEAYMAKEKDKTYLDPEKAIEHKDKGNQFYKEGKWQDAIAEYTESLKRNPKDARVYSNRANAYCKLMAWEPALADCDKALKLDPQFVKPWIRKGKIQHALGQYHKALQCYREAAKTEPNSDDLKEARRETMMAIQRRNMSGEMDEQARARALQDPDVKAAMQDPEVSSVLLQAQSGDQQILYNAMRDRPHIAEKIEFLMAAGVLRLG
jgi:stress-induced-phosphoprotein 1